RHNLAINAVYAGRMDTVGGLYSFGQALNQSRVDVAFDSGLIGLVHLVTRVQQSLGQLTVAGEDQESRGVCVEATDGMQAQVQQLVRSFGQRASSNGIAHSAVSSRSFVKDRYFDPGTLDFAVQHHCGVVDWVGGVANDHTIHPDPALANHSAYAFAGQTTCMGEVLVESLHRHGDAVSQ
ncbi:MAG: hypothetical protein ACJA00_002640, partial [Myxococcota bacterium]